MTTTRKPHKSRAHEVREPRDDIFFALEQAISPADEEFNRAVGQANKNSKSLKKLASHFRACF